MKHAVHNRATIRVADRTDVSGRVTADEVNLDRFHNRIRKVCGLVADRSKVYLSAATMILIVTLAVPAVAQKQVSFSGAIQGHVIGSPQGGTPPPMHPVFGSAAGIATHFGQLSFTYELTVNVGNGTGTGSAQLLIGADGDIIYTAVTGQFKLTSTPNVASIIENNRITGGTGRFVGTQGSFTVERSIDLVTGFTAAVFQGNISLPDAESDSE